HQRGPPMATSEDINMAVDTRESGVREPMDISRSILMASDADFDDWLSAHRGSEREVVVALYKKTSGKQTVTLVALQEAALRHGWVDSLGQRIDDERWAIRFAPRRLGSNWSAKNRVVALRLLDEGRMTAAGLAALPADL
ncbi:MAG: hypothetical protein WD895_08425, partial [Acidimicrobiia bacterium]